MFDTMIERTLFMAVALLLLPIGGNVQPSPPPVFSFTLDLDPDDPWYAYFPEDNLTDIRVNGTLTYENVLPGYVELFEDVPEGCLSSIVPNSEQISGSDVLQFVLHIKMFNVTGDLEFSVSVSGIYDGTYPIDAVSATIRIDIPDDNGTGPSTREKDDDGPALGDIPGSGMAMMLLTLVVMIAVCAVLALYFRRKREARR